MNGKEEKRYFLKKLHRQFGHLYKVRFIELLKNAEISYKELCVIIEEITEKWEVCLKYQKNPNKWDQFLDFL